MNNNIKLDITTLNWALRNRLDETANYILDSGVNPDIQSLYASLMSCLDETANRILDSDVQPDVISLNQALISGLDKTANRILDSGVKPNERSLINALSNSLNKTAKRILDSGVQPDKNNLLVKFFFDHIKSKQNLNNLCSDNSPVSSIEEIYKLKEPLFKKKIKSDSKLKTSKIFSDTHSTSHKRKKRGKGIR